MKSALMNYRVQTLGPKATSCGGHILTEHRTVYIAKTETCCSTYSV